MFPETAGVVSHLCRTPPVLFEEPSAEFQFRRIFRIRFPALTKERMNAHQSESPLVCRNNVACLCPSGLVCGRKPGLRMPASPPPPPPAPPPSVGATDQGKGEGRSGERPMGTTAYGEKGSKGKATNDDRPVGVATCRREQHTMRHAKPPRSRPLILLLWESTSRAYWRRG